MKNIAKNQPYVITAEEEQENAAYYAAHPLATSEVTMHQGNNRSRLIGQNPALFFTASANNSIVKYTAPEKASCVLM